MNKKYLIGFIALVLLLGLFFYFSDGGSSQQRKIKAYNTNWEDSYNRSSPNAKDLQFFNELLAAHTQDSIYALKSFKQLESIPNYEKATYIFIGERFGLENKKYDSIIHLVDSGANLLLSFDYVTQNVYDKHLAQNAYYWEYNAYIHAWVGDTSLRFNHVFQNDTLATDWYVYDEDAILDTNYVAYCFAFNHPIAYYEKHGKGKVHLHSIPELFQNYQLLQPNGFAHCALILKQIPKNRPVIWLDLAILKNEVYQSDQSDDEGEGDDKQDNSLIQFILKNSALRIAFLLSIILLLLYVLFRSKRKESILPGVPEKRNMSLAFMETLSSIYISRNSPIGILQVLRKNFYQTVSRYYYIDLTTKETREENIKRLIEKSDYDSEKLNDILKRLNPKNKVVDAEELGIIYRMIREFYIQTGINQKQTSFASKTKDVLIHKSLISGGIGLIVSFFLLLKGLLLLTNGGGIGVILVIAAGIIVYISYRMISKPMLIIKQDELIYYGMISGKDRYPLNQNVNCTVSKNSTTLYFEDGSLLQIQHIYLSKQGKSALAQFVAFTKLQNKIGRAHV